MCAGSQHVLLMCLQFDTRRTPAPQVSLKSQEALSHSYHSARHECNVNRARAEGDTEVHFYHGEHHVQALWLQVCMLSLLCSTVHCVLHPHCCQELFQVIINHVQQLYCLRGEFGQWTLLCAGLVRGLDQRGMCEIGVQTKYI